MYIYTIHKHKREEEEDEKFIYFSFISFPLFSCCCCCCCSRMLFMNYLWWQPWYYCCCCYKFHPLTYIYPNLLYTRRDLEKMIMKSDARTVSFFYVKWQLKWRILWILKWALLWWVIYLNLLIIFYYSLFGMPSTSDGILKIFASNLIPSYFLKWNNFLYDSNLSWETNFWCWKLNLLDDEIWIYEFLLLFLVRYSWFDWWLYWGINALCFLFFA